ncbi:HNH endonuclease signature motif containing protein, partial [Mycobacterium sp. OTB74]|uniref:HNH endonuclease signature motif containing protein n=1 Tax=Mycobacterium sp. OTB74 TaxID=1853452 RepID=UPI002474EC06
LEAAAFDAALASHHDGLIADWKRDHDTEAHAGEQAPPFPDTVDAFMSLIEAGWDTDVAHRPHGQHTTVVVHLDVEHDTAALHLGPLLTDDERRLLLCDATCELWLQRHGQPIGAGRTTRTISRRMRRALEHRDRCCVVPGCGATRGLHAHHIQHWEDGGPTDLHNLVLLCPHHHRLHHHGGITITGPADRLIVTDSTGKPLSGGSLARPPTTPPPAVPPCPGPTGERAQWWWYQPFQPPPPALN